jgi:hypothetical protein
VLTFERVLPNGPPGKTGWTIAIGRGAFCRARARSIRSSRLDSEPLASPPAGHRSVAGLDYSIFR